MPIPRVWSERIDTVPGWHDCTQSATLDALVYGGKLDYEKGIYTPAERVALEAADDRTDNTGATLLDIDLAVKRRYGLTLHRLPDDSQATFRSFLSKSGYAFIVQGSYSNMVDRLRKLWQPGYTGGHAVCVITLGYDHQLLLDPMAPNLYGGDVVSTDEVLKFAWDGAQYSRYVVKDEFIEMIYVKTIMYAQPRAVSVKAGVPIPAYYPPSHDVVRTVPVPKNTMFHARGEAFVTGWSDDPKNLEWEYWIADDGTFGPDNNGGKALFVPKNADRLIAAPLPDLDADLKKANALAASLQARLAKKDLVFDSIGAAVAQKVSSGKAV